MHKSRPVWFRVEFEARSVGEIFKRTRYFFAVDAKNAEQAAQEVYGCWPGFRLLKAEQVTLTPPKNDKRPPGYFLQRLYATESKNPA